MRQHAATARAHARALLLLGALAPALPACRQDGPRRTAGTTPPASEPANREAERRMRNRIDKDEALEIACEDARRAYGDLTLYDVTIELRDGNWQVDYVLRDREAQ